MRKFILKISLFLTLLLLIVAGCCLYMHRYLLTHSDKALRYSHERNFVESIDKLKSKSEPSIIIVGGSGCGFGFLSDSLAKHFNMPVINAGTHAGFGLRLIMDAVEPYVATGDIVLFIPEYEHFSGTDYWGEEVALHATYMVPEMFDQMSVFQVLHLLPYYPKYYQQVKGCQALSYTADIRDTTGATPYSYCSLNEFGDVTMYEKRMHRNDIASSEASMSIINQVAISAAKRFIKSVEAKGAVCIFLPPALRDIDFDIDRASIKRKERLFKIDKTEHAGSVRTEERVTHFS